MSVTVVQPALNLREKIAAMFRPKWSELPKFKWISNLVSNGTFDTDLTGWTNNSSHWTWVSNTANHPSSAAFLPLSQQLTGLTVGATYTVSADVVITTGVVKVILDSTSSMPTSVNLSERSSSGVLSATFVYDGTLDWIGFSRSAAATSEFTVDNVSVRELYTLPSSSEVISVFDTGLLLQEGATEDYTVDDDGQLKTINFAVDPGLEDDVRIEYRNKL